jgi:hypothetical protein
VRIAIWVGAALSALVTASPAAAALGGTPASIQADQASMQAAGSVARLPQYAVYQLTTPWGTTVREYVSAAGVVFGIGWDGPSMPDLQTTLGPYFKDYVAAAAARRDRGPFAMNDGTLVAYSGGHLRAFNGHAYLPQAVPAGVDITAIR